MLLLQAALCFSSNGLAVLVAILFLRDAGGQVAARLGAAVFLCSIGYSLNLLPGPLRLPEPLYIAAALMNVPTLGLNLLFGRALLLDGFRMGAREWFLLVVLSLLMLLVSRPLIGLPSPGQGLATAALGLAGLAVMAHLFWIAATEYRTDLVDSRRRVRIDILVFALGNTAVVSIIELRGMSIVAEGIAFDTGTLVLSSTIILWITRTDPMRLFPPPAKGSPAPTEPKETAPRVALGKHRLLQAMEHDEVWRDETLTITSLAGRLAMPEHQLRALINKEMGHRNFAAFLNGYRLGEAKRRLANPEEAGIPILTIAMESGYRTLSTSTEPSRPRRGDSIGLPGESDQGKYQRR
ncbi:helix-turn-helix transcriptional regulator [Parvularcula maris]|uniref:HTH araC/xylS-type domain-containing protein n=1 Tax=Parvularcula maris TaxID=2965077 RepID=A0A9X2RIJ2_9PROT|nr:hypothetical protein [Parvularcula maris]MCQ8186120.1 hypothetical protein [Parvularcula maris]